MKRKDRDFNELVIKELRDPEFAATYLNEHLSYKGPHHRELILEALKQIAEAQGYAQLAKTSGVSRRTFYHAFSSEGNPTLDTFLILLKSVGLNMRFESAKRGRARRAA